MVVAIPPRMLAKPIGISVPVADAPVRTATPIKMGSISTTMGVLLMKALSTAVISKVRISDMPGPRRHRRARNRPTGSRAPVLIMPWPTIIRAETAIKARLPKPRKNSLGRTTPVSDW